MSRFIEDGLAGLNLISDEPKAQTVKPSPFTGRKTLDRDQTNKVMSLIRGVMPPNNLLSISRLRGVLANIGYTSASEQDAVIQSLRSKYLISASGPEGQHGSTPEERAGWMRNGGETIAYISIR